MYCLTNMCYVCLEHKDSLLNNLNSSSSANSDIIHIMCDLPFDLAWLNTMRTILVCEECCSRLRETHQLRAMCLKNSALLRDYVDKLNTGTESSRENAAELTVTLDLHNQHTDMNEVHSTSNTEIISKKHVDDKQDRLSTGTIEETGDVFMNVQDYFVKEENSWKQEPADDTEEYPMDTNSTEITAETEDLILNPEDYFVKEEESGNREETDEMEETEDREETEDDLSLVSHMRTHTGEKPHGCSTCNKSFSSRLDLVRHVRTHTGEKPFSCSTCNKSFADRSNLVAHMRAHTGEKPHSCSTCKRSFSYRSHLVSHMRTHTGEKPHSCSRCDKCFARRWHLVRHMRVHTRE